MIAPDNTDGSERNTDHAGSDIDPASRQVDSQGKSALNILQEEIRSLKKHYENEIQKLKDDNERRTKEIENTLYKAVSVEEKRIKNSWSWRIGRVPVVAVVLITNFIRNPFGFFTNQQCRFRNIYFFPNPSDQKTRTGTGSSATQSSSGDEKSGAIAIDPDKLTVTTIFDTFTKKCFSPEFNILSPTTENWKALTEQYSPQALFVESAWSGNNGSWMNLVGKVNEKNVQLLSELVIWYKRKNKPAIFWNKEDPVYFDFFLEAAKQFDYIFTTDADCIPKYQELTKCRNIYALPFAAQPEIHNPIARKPRNGKVCFAGTYYNEQFAERKIDLDILLKPALDYGLEIYDRNFGTTGKGSEQFRFPEIYHASVKGNLAYTEMIETYKEYKVFLNVNSVRYSPTMFARRVFEILACGTPVISSYSKGIINLLGEGTVLISECEKDTREHLDRLLGDQHFWWEQSLKGIRKVMEHHTYQNRTNLIFSVTGLDPRQSEPVRFLCIAEINNIENAAYLSGIIREQAYSDYTVLLLAGLDTDFDEEQLAAIRKIFSFVKTEIIPVSSAREIKFLLEHSEYSHAVFLNAANYYGKNYLRDFSLAIRYSGAKILGRKSGFSSGQNGTITEYNMGHEFRFVNDVPADTLVIQKKLLSGKDIAVFTKNEDFTTTDASVFSIDPFGFLRNGRSALETNREHVLKTIDI